MKATITTELVRKPPAGPCDVRDTKLTGFVLRVSKAGRGTFYALPRRGVWTRLGTPDRLTVAEAREAARAVLGKPALDRAFGREPHEGPRKAAPTFAAFVRDKYTPWATAQRKTGAEQAARLERVFGPALNAQRLDEINQFTVERWRSSRLKAGRAATTVNRDLNVLRGALSRAVEWGLVRSHPLAGVKASKTDAAGGVVRFLDADEEKRLRAALKARDDRRQGERERANAWRRERGYAEWPAYGTHTDHLTPIVLLALNTGLRRGELFGLTWGAVDLVRRNLTVRGEGAKSGQTRHVPLNQEAADVLRDWRGGDEPRADDLVFPSPVPDQPLSDIKTAWHALMKAARIREFRFHDCRHHFASRLVMAGVDLNTVRELLGHADLKMTLRYAHLAPEHKAAAVELLAQR